MTSKPIVEKKQSLFPSAPDKYDGDIYETKDSTADEANNTKQSRRIVPKPNPDIEVTSIDPELAFEKFAGYIYDPSNLDFSSPVKIHQIVSNNITEFKSAKPNYKYESPIETFNRIKHEIEQFRADLSQVTAQSKDKTSKDPIVDLCKILNEEIAKLSKQLVNLSNDPQYQAYLKEDLPSAAVPTSSNVIEPLNRLKAELTAFKQSPATQEILDKDKKMTYEIYLPNLPSSTAANTTAAANLEKRITALESSLGLGESLPIPFKNLRDAITDFDRKLSLLDKSKLEALYRRMQAMLRDIEILEKSKDQVAVETSDNQVTDLYSMMNRWDAAAKQLPAVINRLRSLKTLHSLSSQTAIRVKQINDSLTELKKLVKDDTEAIKKLEASLSQNTAIIQTNVANLEKRMANLEAKIKK